MQFKMHFISLSYYCGCGCCFHIVSGLHVVSSMLDRILSNYYLAPDKHVDDCKKMKLYHGSRFLVRHSIQMKK